MAKQLNIGTFNEILLSAAKDDEAKIGILEAEMGIVADMFYSEVACLLDELSDSGYTSERFTRIQNIKDNTEAILDEIERLKAQRR